MSRFARSLRWLLNVPRLSRKAGAKTIQTPEGQTVIVHRVRINSRGPVSRRINNFCITGAAVYVAGSIILEFEFFKDAFLPFPFTTRRLDPQPYAGSDPEWQSFIKVARDKQLQEMLRLELANLVLHKAATSRVLSARLGTDIKIRRYWMDIDYPYYAPSEYEMSGLHITEDSIKWTSKPVDSAAAKMLGRVLWPRPVAVSFWSLSAALTRQKIAEVARYLGLEVDDGPGAQPGSLGPGSPHPLPTSHGPRMQKALEQMRQQATKRPGEVDDPRSMTPAPLDAPASSRNKASTAAGKVNAEGEDGRPSIKRLASVDTLRSAVGLSPWQIFIKKYAQTWKPIRADPPRGSIAISGLVELETPKAWIVIDVLGWYHPEKRTFDEPSLWMPVRRFQYKQQSPLR